MLWPLLFLALILFFDECIRWVDAQQIICITLWSEPTVGVVSVFKKSEKKNKFEAMQ